MDITIDNSRAAFDAVSHLLRCGRRNIAMINGRSVADVSLLRREATAGPWSRPGLKCSPAA